MALNPDDLLIFKVREQEENQETKKAKKQERPTPQKKEVQRPAPAPRPPPPQMKQPVYVEPVEEAHYIAPPEEVEASIPIIENVAAPSDIVEAALGTSLGTEQMKGRKKGKMVRDSRKIAEHMSCELHPWRNAYAICGYCKRAFCYEDILESGGKYYCLDDIDKVPQLARRAQVIRYNNLSLFSSVMFMLVFLAFIYYSYPQVVAMFQAMARLGLLTFISDTNPGELLFVGEIVLAVMALVSAIAVLLNSPSSFRTSAIVGILTVVLFGYQYLNSTKVYLLEIAILSFIGMVTLAYSRVSYESLPEGVMFDGDGSPLGISRSSF